MARRKLRKRPLVAAPRQVTSADKLDEVRKLLVVARDMIESAQRVLEVNSQPVENNTRENRWPTKR